MANHSISHAVLSISTPASNVFLGNQTLSVGLARLLNEWLAEVSARAVVDAQIFIKDCWLTRSNPISSCGHFQTVSPSSLSHPCHTSAQRKQCPQVSFLSTVRISSLKSPFSITEVNYALDELHARGIGLLTNHEGLYLGHIDLRPFFAALNSTSSRLSSIFVHPTTAFLRINGR